MLFILNGDLKRLKKLTDEIHNDHLKGLSTYPRTVEDAQILIVSHSSAVVVKKKNVTVRWCLVKHILMVSRLRNKKRFMSYL